MTINTHRCAIPIHLALDGCHAEIISDPKLGEDGIGIALSITDLKAARHSLDLLESDVLCMVLAQRCAVGDETSRKISVEEKDAMIAKYSTVH